VRRFFKKSAPKTGKKVRQKHIGAFSKKARQKRGKKFGKKAA
jgi:hypothetical protein